MDELSSESRTHALLGFTQVSIEAQAAVGFETRIAYGDVESAVEEVAEAELHTLHAELAEEVDVGFAVFGADLHLAVGAGHHQVEIDVEFGVGAVFGQLQVEVERQGLAVAVTGFHGIAKQGVYSTFIAPVDRRIGNVADVVTHETFDHGDKVFFADDCRRDVDFGHFGIGPQTGVADRGAGKVKYRLLAFVAVNDLFGVGFFEDFGSVDPQLYFGNAPSVVAYFGDVQLFNVFQAFDRRLDDVVDLCFAAFAVVNAIVEVIGFHAGVELHVHVVIGSGIFGVGGGEKHLETVHFHIFDAGRLGERGRLCSQAKEGCHKKQGKNERLFHCVEDLVCE